MKQPSLETFRDLLYDMSIFSWNLSEYMVYVKAGH